MKKNNTTGRSPRQAKKASQKPITIGMDLGDKASRCCKLEGDRHLRKLLVQGAHGILRYPPAGHGSEALGCEAGDSAASDVGDGGTGFSASGELSSALRWQHRFKDVGPQLAPEQAAPTQECEWKQGEAARGNPRPF